MQTILANTDPSAKQQGFKDRTKHSIIGFVSGAALLGVLTGCVGYVDGPRHGYAYAAPPPVYMQPPSVEVEASVGAVGVSIRAESDFYEPLTPHGEWVVVGSYGRCWRPARV